MGGKRVKRKCAGFRGSQRPFETPPPGAGGGGRGGRRPTIFVARRAPPVMRAGMVPAKATVKSGGGTHGGRVGP